MSWRVRIGGLFRNARRSGELSHVGRLVPGRAVDSSAAFVGADTWLMRDTLQCGSQYRAARRGVSTLRLAPSASMILSARRGTTD
jgi:hypothetical protein